MKQLFVYKKNRKSWFLYYPIFSKDQEQYLLERYSHAPYKTVIIKNKKLVKM